MKSLTIPFAAASLLVVALATGGPGTPAPAATPPPTPPPPSQTTPTPVPVTPIPSPSPTPTATAMPGVQGLFGGSHNGHGPQSGAHSTPTPPAQTRVGIEGVWEAQIQRGPRTTYVHFNLKQQQNALLGTYLDEANKPAPIVGTVAGDDVRLVVTLPNGSTIVFEGKLDGTTDMIGMMTTPNEQVPFTAGYRPKENFYDNLNEQPGGLANPMPSPPPK